MPDEFDLARGPELPQALLALPSLAPPQSAWPALQSTLASQRRARWGMPLWIAAAVALTAIVLLPRGMVAPRTEAIAPLATVVQPASPPLLSADQESLVRLMRESAQLEALIAWSREEHVESAAFASLGIALQTRVEQLDALLARTELDPDARLPLWQERVLRLRQLAGLESTEQWLAANGETEPGAFVLAF